ncbi:uncharacterized protein ColSpa_04459 [Colletotrichum spaethianum]|uniref:Uncharacterized protein n=1 Tax=Colletotrichum spaethianum TaxID=700344 RepID=A0AA37L9F5_9PEZI|nr:uncharacterized protein ColSpa_04459 [Colletotrichum spaethianum]GKT44278.1 hypothetical protein ColSpa_04459 [Colletotrichum spaethianum]
MRVSSLVAALASATTVYAACAADNCYRNVKGQEIGSAFCATFTTDIVTETSGIPAGISTSCGVSRLSSACSCVYPSTTYPSATTGPGCFQNVTVSTKTLPASTVIITASAETVTLPRATITLGFANSTVTVFSTVTITDPPTFPTSITTIPAANSTFTRTNSTITTTF